MSNENFETVSVDVENELMTRIESQAKALHITPSEYCRLVLQQWLDTTSE
jgi:hypothetical protein